MCRVHIFDSELTPYCDALNDCRDEGIQGGVGEGSSGDEDSPQQVISPSCASHKTNDIKESNERPFYLPVHIWGL